jgi:hypothetical protein
MVANTLMKMRSKIKFQILIASSGPYQWFKFLWIEQTSLFFIRRQPQDDLWKTHPCLYMLSLHKQKKMKGWKFGTLTKNLDMNYILPNWHVKHWIFEYMDDMENLLGKSIICFPLQFFSRWSCIILGWSFLYWFWCLLTLLVGAHDLWPLWSPPVSLNLVSSIPLIGTDSS